MTSFRPYLATAMSGRALTGDEMRAAMTELLSGNISDIEIAAFLAALRARGETVEEIAAATIAMRDKATPVDIDLDVVDTCGTGGDGADTFNISTAAAIIAAGAGASIAKHGNKAASSKSGSSEVLEALGVNLMIAPAQITKCICEAGIGFMFAATHHGAVKHVATARKTIGIRTMFNLLGPLSNPAGAKRQVMGVFDKELLEPIANVMLHLNVEHALVVHGGDGLDELTTTDITHVAELKNGAVRNYTVTPEQAGLPRANAVDLKGGTPAQNAAAITALLAGECGAFRDIAVFNAAAALVVADMASDLKSGVQFAQAAIDNGRAAHALAALVRISNEAT